MRYFGSSGASPIPAGNISLFLLLLCIEENPILCCVTRVCDTQCGDQCTTSMMDIFSCSERGTPWEVGMVMIIVF